MTIPKPLDAFPERMTAKDVAEFLGVTVYRVYQLHRDSALDFAACRPKVGRLAWDRDRLRAYVRGDIKGLTGLRKVG